MSLVLQSSIDLQTPSAAPAQILLAVLVLVFAAGGLLAAQYLTRFTGLPEGNRRHAEVLAMQLDAKTPARLRLPIDTDFGEKRFQIRDLWTVGPSEEGGVEEEAPTIREAIDELHSLLLERWSERLGHLPLYSIRLAEEAIVLLVLGALAVISVERWEHALSVTTPTPDLGAAVADLQVLTARTIEAGLTLITAFPYGDVVWALVFAYAIQLYQWLYHYWFVLAAILFAGAGIIALLDFYVEATDARLIEDRRAVAARAAGAALIVWLAGVAPAAAGAAAGVHEYGALAGFLLAGVAMLAILGFTGRWLAGEVKAAADWYVEDAPSRYIAAYLLVRRVWGVFAVIGATLIPVYLVVILADGRLLAIFRAFGHASTEIQLLTAMLFVSVVVVLALATRDAWPDLVAALRSKLGEQSIRRALFGRGAPFGVMVLAYLVGVGFTLPVGVAVLLAILAGVAARGLYLLAARVKHRAQAHDDPLDRPAMIYIEAFTLEDADGQDHFVARVNGKPLARSTLAPLVDEVLANAEALQDRGEYAATFGQYHADNLIQHGIIDEESSRSAMKREITATFEDLFDQYGRVPPEAADDELSRYPDDVVSEKERALRTEGADGWRLTKRHGYYVRI